LQREIFLTPTPPKASVGQNPPDKVSTVKILSAIVTATVLAAATPAQAQKVDLSTITCKQFIEMNRESVSLILMWMAGYYSDQDAPPIVDFDKMKENASKLGGYCAKNPTVGLITAAEETIAE
jgi:acid stress chaperone HdeB